MIKTLLGSLREYKKGSILTILLSILEAAFEILIPLRMADLIDQGIDLGNMAAVWIRKTSHSAPVSRSMKTTPCPANWNC